MRFQTDLVPARLVKRYKRFLADCTLDDGRAVTAHCANPGSMMGLADPGTKVWLEPNDDPRKKLRYGLRLVDHENGHLTGVDTSLPNRVLKDALEAREISGLPGYDTVRSEVKYDTDSRIDFLLQGADGVDTYVEVKSVTLSRTKGLAEFPDSVTARGTKHLQALARVVEAGQKAIMLYFVQRTDCDAVTLADDIDPKYAAAFTEAQQAGVDVLSLSADINTSGVTVARRLQFVF